MTQPAGTASPSPSFLDRCGPLSPDVVSVMAEALRCRPEDELHTLVAAALRLPRPQSIPTPDRTVERQHRLAVFTTWEHNELVGAPRPAFPVRPAALTEPALRVAGHCAYVELGSRAFGEFFWSREMPRWLASAIGPMPPDTHPLYARYLGRAGGALAVARGLHIPDCPWLGALRCRHDDPHGYARRTLLRLGIDLRHIARAMQAPVPEPARPLRLVRPRSTESPGRDM